MLLKKLSLVIFLVLTASACAGKTVYIPAPQLPVGVDPVYPVFDIKKEFVRIDKTEYYRVHKSTLVKLVDKIGMQATRIDGLKATILGKVPGDY